MIKNYLSSIGLFCNFEKDKDLTYSSVIELDLTTVQPCVSGPKRPHDYVELNDMKNDWNNCLVNEIGFKGFGLSKEKVNSVSKFELNGV